jgi:hypothetical protein
MPCLDIDQALRFLDLLDLGGRHTIASEHPFGGPVDAATGIRGPRWEPGITYEPNERKLLIADIKWSQERGANVYYSVNRPCPASERQGAKGKNNLDDIVCIRAFAFDIDFVVKRTDAQECFMIAVSGGERYGQPGRGWKYFMRQWMSHRPLLDRRGTRTLGSLFHVCAENKMDMPWISKSRFYTHEQFLKDVEELRNLNQSVDEKTLKMLGVEQYGKGFKTWWNEDYNEVVWVK